MNRITTRVNGRVIEHIDDRLFVDGQEVQTFPPRESRRTGLLWAAIASGFALGWVIGHLALDWAAK